MSSARRYYRNSPRTPVRRQPITGSSYSLPFNDTAPNSSSSSWFPVQDRYVAPSDFSLLPNNSSHYSTTNFTSDQPFALDNLLSPSFVYTESQSSGANCNGPTSLNAQYPMASGLSQEEAGATSSYDFLQPDSNSIQGGTFIRGTQDAFITPGNSSARSMSFDMASDPIQFSPDTTRFPQPPTPGYVTFNPVYGAPSSPLSRRGRQTVSSRSNRDLSRGPSHDGERPRNSDDSSSGKGRLACPIIDDPEAMYGACTNKGFKDWGRVREHIQRRHVSRLNAKQKQQIDDLGKTMRGKSDEDKWYAAWAIIYPNIPAPSTAEGGDLVNFQACRQHVTSSFIISLRPTLETTLPADIVRIVMPIVDRVLGTSFDEFRNTY